MLPTCSTVKPSRTFVSVPFECDSLSEAERLGIWRTVGGSIIRRNWLTQRPLGALNCLAKYVPNAPPVIPSVGYAYSLLPPRYHQWPSLLGTVTGI